MLTGALHVHPEIFIAYSLGIGCGHVYFTGNRPAAVVIVQLRRERELCTRINRSDFDNLVESVAVVEDGDRRDRVIVVLAELHEVAYVKIRR